MNWKGVMPAITTCFDQNLKVDHDLMAKHYLWLLENGCSGIVLLGSLGEGATLSFDEKLQIVRSCVKNVRRRAPVVASVSALSTADAVSQAKAFADAGWTGKWRRTFPPCSAQRRFPACFTTIRSHTALTSFPNEFRSWPCSTKTWLASKNPAPM